MECNTSLTTPDVIFIGAGPVGLWTAIQTKLLEPKLHILMFEKHPQYQRSHPLKMSMTSFWNTINDTEFQRLIYSMLGKKISTNDIEQSLLTFATKIGIQILHSHIDNPMSFINTYYPKVKVVVGSDGSHSIVRKTIFGDKFAYNYNLKYIADFRYTINSVTDDSKQRKKKKKLQKHNDDDCNDEHDRQYDNDYDKEYECVTKNKDNVTEITTRCFMSEIEYNKLKHGNNGMKATFKDPATYNEQFVNLVPEVCAKFTNKVTKQKHTITSPITVTATHLDVYKCEKVVMTDANGRYWLLVGDAAFAVPYFRALNDGLLAGSLVARKIVETISPYTNIYNFLPMRLANNIYRTTKALFISSDPIYEYQYWFDLLSHYETSKANVKTLFVESSIVEYSSFK